MSFENLPLHELAALATATCWALTSMLAPAGTAHLGAFAFNRLRQVSVALMLAGIVLLSARWQGPSWNQIFLLCLSGFTGIFVGDTLLFAGLNRLGPRRNGVLFALNAPIAAVLGWLFLNERLAGEALLGIALTAAGVMLSIFFGNRATNNHSLEAIKGPLWIGVGLGLCAALGQALGNIIARPVMSAGFDPFVAALLRVGTAGACLSLALALPIPAIKPKNPLTWPIAFLTISTGILAMGVGATLLLYALSGGKTGIISSLSATSPVLLLPMLWLRTGKPPALGAWAGSILVIIGIALIFLFR